MSDYQLKNSLEKFSYSLGMTISSNLIESGVTEIDAVQFIAAVQDTFSGNQSKLTESEAGEILNEFMSKLNSGASDKNLEKGLLFLAENIDKEGVYETETGLQYKILKKGDGDLPDINDKVKCHYHGTLIDGKVFDSSVERKQPAIFPVNAVITGWVEALQMMPVGSTWRLFIPSNLAYGENGAGNLIGPNSTLIFDVDLLEIV